MRPSFFQPSVPTVLIPDVHQDIQWLNAVLKETSGFEKVIFMGDIFDPKTSRAASLEDALNFYFDLLSDSRITFLAGNHDVSAYALWSAASGYYKQFTEDRSFWKLWMLKGAREWFFLNFDQFPWLRDLFARMQPMAYSNGKLLSHAGVHPSFLPADAGLTDLQALFDKAHKSLHEIPYSHTRPAEWSAGEARGGEYGKVGGMSWLDFRREFEDGLRWPQIVGHTPGSEPRYSGRSLCLDCLQTTYSILETDGSVAFRTISEESTQSA